MVVKQMKLAAKPIAYRNNNKITGMFESKYGTQYAMFAKTIIDKYTKTLNYHFDYTALVFLEQMAGMEKRQQISRNVVNITWKLLSFLFKEREKKNLMINQNSLIVNQVTKQIENNLEQIKNEDVELYRDLEKCYKVYEREIKNETIKNKAEWKMIEHVIKHIEEQEQQTALFWKENKKEKTAITPFTMNKAFFQNLNHVINENKIMSYRQIWKKSVEHQLEQYYLDTYMNIFAKEQQTDRKQALFYDIFQRFDEKAISYYLMKNDRGIYAQFIEYMQSIIGVYDNGRKAEVYNISSIRQDRIRNIEKSNDNYLRERIEQDKVEKYNEETQQKTERDIEEYKHIHERIKEILGETTEITRNIVIEKSKEYKELFYDYIQTNSMEREEPESVQDVKNPKIFSTSEIELLLTEKESVEHEKEYSQEIQQEIFFLKEKLELLAIKEVVERCLAEDRGVLHIEKIQKIAQILENIDFQSEQEEKIKSIHFKDILENVDFQSEQEEKDKSVYFKDILENADFQSEQEDKSIYFKNILEEGDFLERKLLYLAMEEGVNEVLTEETEEYKNMRKDILALKNKIVQEEDFKKRMRNDWRFLMKKDRSVQIVKAIEELPQKEKIWLEEKAGRKIENFYRMQYEIYRYYEQSKESESEKYSHYEQSKESESEKYSHYEQSKESESEKYSYYEQSKESERSLWDIYLEHKDIWKEWSPFFSKDELLQMQNKIQNKRIEENKIYQSSIDKNEKLSIKAENFIQRKQEEKNKTIDFKDILENVDFQSEQEDKSVYFKNILEEGDFLERKLFYLAMEEGVNEVLTEETEEFKSMRENILALKNKIVQEEDFKKRMTGDRRFLMKKDVTGQPSAEKLQKEQSVQIVKAIEELPQKEKTWLEERVARKIENFYRMQDEIYGYYEQWKESDSEKYSHYEQSKESERSLWDIYLEHKDIWKEWSTFFSKDELLQMQNKIQNKRIEENKIYQSSIDKNEKLSIKAENFIQRKQEEKNKTIDFRDILENIDLQSEQEEKDKSIYFRDILENVDFQSEQEEKSKSIYFKDILENIDFQSEQEDKDKSVYFKNILEEGDFLERKLLYLVMKEGVNEVLTEETEEYKSMRENILVLKNKIIQEEDFTKRMTGDGRFLMKKDVTGQPSAELLQKEQSVQIVKAIKELPQKEKIWLEERVARKIENFYRMQDEIYGYYEQWKESESKKYNHYEQWKESESKKYNHYEQSKESEKSLWDIYLEHKDIWKEWSPFFSKDELLQMQNKIQNKRIEENKIYQSSIDKNETEKKLFYFGLKKGKINENVERKLKNIKKYVKIWYNSSENLEKYYNFAKCLKKEKNNYIDEEFQKIDYLTKNNLNFMEPPSSFTDQSNKSDISQKIQYQEEAVHFILNYTRNNEQNEHNYAHETDVKEHENYVYETGIKEHENYVYETSVKEREHENYVYETSVKEREHENYVYETSVKEHERIIKELESNILECQLELGDKDERLDAMEKIIKEQEKNIQFLKETQNNISRQINSGTQTKEIFNQLKDELHLEQMRNGRL